MEVNLRDTKLLRFQRITHLLGRIGWSNIWRESHKIPTLWRTDAGLEIKSRNIKHSCDLDRLISLCLVNKCYLCFWKSFFSHHSWNLSTAGGFVCLFKGFFFFFSFCSQSKNPNCPMKSILDATAKHQKRRRFGPRRHKLQECRSSFSSCWTTPPSPLTPSYCLFCCQQNQKQ